jgi:hypothetical protein
MVSKLVLALGAALSACGDRSQEATDGSASSPSDVAEAPRVTDAPIEAAADESPDGAWHPLFDGRSLAAWDRYLGKPSASEPPLGLDDDPRDVFSIVTLDGAPAIRVSGEVWGALISKETFCDFHLRAQYKWGARVWPPLDVRDSGLMYLSTGPLGAVDGGGPALSDPAGSGAFMADQSLVPAVGHHIRRFGWAPRLAATDRGFYSSRGEQSIVELGVLRPAIPWRDYRSPKRIL